MTMISWEFKAPVWWHLAPLTTMPPDLSSTTWRNRSGSACWLGRLPRSPFGSVHRAVADQIVVLHVFQEIVEPLMIASAAAPIDLVGGAGEGIDGIHSHAALEAGARILPQQPLHLDLVHQIGVVPVGVGEAVDPPARQMGRSGHEILAAGIMGQFIGHGDGIEGRPDEGMVHGRLDLFPEGEGVEAQPPDAFDVFLRNFHGSYLYFMSSRAMISFMT